MAAAATETIEALPKGKQLPVAIALLVHFAVLSARLDDDVSAGYARKQPEREGIDIAEIIQAAAEACNE